ncbi:hypothetical protein H0H93_015050 [Arthromyces matolae]|nr:hypothetical protein H0H93_015050 [Arthromyces matolae]
MPEPSPFADPEIAPAGALPIPGEATPRPSTDSVARAIDEFPVPPSPAHSRIDSNPPMLPEIQLDSRPASYDFPASVRGSGFASGIPVSVTKDYSRSPLANGFPLTPSPLASSFAITSPPPASTEFPTAAAAAADSPPPTPRLDKTQEAPKKRPDTVYDDEDAYGGI